MMKHYFVFLIFAFIPTYAGAQLEGKVIGISDGDTFTLLVDKETIKVRLHGIDCPEKSQDFGIITTLVYKTYASKYLHLSPGLLTKFNSTYFKIL